MGAVYPGCLYSKHYFSLRLHVYLKQRLEGEGRRLSQITPWHQHCNSPSPQHWILSLLTLFLPPFHSLNSWQTLPTDLCPIHPSIHPSIMAALSQWEAKALRQRKALLFSSLPVGSLYLGFVSQMTPKVADGITAFLHKHLSPFPISSASFSLLLLSSFSVFFPFFLFLFPLFFLSSFLFLFSSCPLCML